MLSLCRRPHLLRPLLARRNHEDGSTIGDTSDVNPSIPSYSQDPSVTRIRVTPKQKRQWIDSLRIFVKGGHGGNGYPKKSGLGGTGGNVYIGAEIKC